jgi:hypothetical protein
MHTNRSDVPRPTTGPWYLNAAHLLWAVLLLGVSCAKVAQPLPPVVSPLPATQQLELVQVGTTIRLTYPRPSADIRTVSIFMQCGPQTEWAPLEPIAVIEFPEGPVTPPEKLSYSEVAPPPDCRYAIRYGNGRRRLSAYSNIRETSPEPAPLPPTALQADVLNDRIVVTWMAPKANVEGGPATVVGYLVNGVHSASTPQFVDTTFEFGQQRGYRVQTIGRLEDPLTLSVPSEELTIIPRDTFGPPAPVGVVGLFSGGQVRLVWEVVEAADLAGYRVYRGLEPDQMQIVASLVPSNSFVDASPPRVETALYYRVSALDRSGNEGEKSAPARIEPSLR